jgi:hypothetical protein
MKELWLARDESFIIFDTKEMKEILGCPKFEDDVVINLTDEEYKDYCRVLIEFYAWQNKLGEMFKD